jgi:sugar lactone lactonase YvrE
MTARLIGEARAVTRQGALLGEGPRWDARRNRLLWVDIQGGALHVFDPRSGADRAVDVGDTTVGAAAPIAGEARVLVALADRLAVVDVETGALETRCPVPHPRPGMRTNDGACDPAGRFWIGTMAIDLEPCAGSLYRYDPDGVLHTVLSGVSLSNGLGWSPDGRTMYYIDSPEQRVDAFDFDVASGTVAGRRAFARIAAEEGTPDGLCLDDEGGVWIGLWGGGEVRRYTPDGEHDATVTVPVDDVTACWFGGPEAGTLFITTASVGVPESRRELQPLAGCLFAIDAGYSGPAATPFGARSTAPSDAEETRAR